MMRKAAMYIAIGIIGVVCLMLLLRSPRKKILTADEMAKYPEQELKFECTQDDVVFKIWMWKKDTDGTIPVFLIHEWKDSTKRPIGERRYTVVYAKDGLEPTMVATYTPINNPTSDTWYPSKFTAKASDDGGLRVHFDNNTTKIMSFSPSR